MPKIIPNIRENIIKSAHRQLNEGGYARLSLREIAKDCNIALGTTYHYFQNKQDLAIAVLNDDWEKEVVQKVHYDTAVLSAEDASVVLFEALYAYCLKYQYLLLERRAGDDIFISMDLRFNNLIENLIPLLRELLTAYHIKETDAMLKTLSEVMISLSARNTSTQDFHQLASIYFQSKA